MLAAAVACCEPVPKYRPRGLRAGASGPSRQARASIPHAGAPTSFGTTRHGLSGSRRPAGSRFLATSRGPSPGESAMQPIFPWAWGGFYISGVCVCCRQCKPSSGRTGGPSFSTDMACIQAIRPGRSTPARLHTKLANLARSAIHVAVVHELTSKSKFAKRAIPFANLPSLQTWLAVASFLTVTVSRAATSLGALERACRVE